MKYKIIAIDDEQRIVGLVQSGLIRATFNDPSPGNRHWEEYQQWLAAGNTPEPPDPLPEPVDPGPSLQERVEAAETIIDLLLMEGLL
jgi:hypothetical protein